MQGWYKDASDRPPPLHPLAHIYLETLTAKRAELYAHVLPTGIPITIKVPPFTIYDHIPGEEDIDKAVMRICMHRA